MIFLIFMANKYGISEDVLKKIGARDKNCVYCHKPMIYPYVRKKQRDCATIEHLNHLPPWDNPVTVVICCGSCNSSRGKKLLLNWFLTPYCIERKRGINEQTVAKPVKEYIQYVDRFLNRLEWTFAKTMPKTPHEYIVRDKLSSSDKKTFDAFHNYLHNNDYSYLGTFESHTYRYLNIGRHKYWVIKNILNREKI